MLAVHWRDTLGQMFVLYLMTVAFVIFLFVVQPHHHFFALKMEIFN